MKEQDLEHLKQLDKDSPDSKNQAISADEAAKKAQDAKKDGPKKDDADKKKADATEMKAIIKDISSIKKELKRFKAEEKELQKAKEIHTQKLEQIEKERERERENKPVPEYEEIEVLKNHKISMLEQILKQAVETKYKISFVKGSILVFKCLIFFFLLVSIAIKANIFSILYLLFAIMFMMLSKYQTRVLVFITPYICLCLSIQYLMFMLNLTQATSPQLFPDQFKNYPFGKMQNYGKNQLYPIPIFLHNPKYQDLKFGYFLGIGIDRTQLEWLFLDFVILSMISYYILGFTNPIFLDTTEKVFWKFPTPNDISTFDNLDVHKEN